MKYLLKARFRNTGKDGGWVHRSCSPFDRFPLTFKVRGTDIDLWLCHEIISGVWHCHNPAVVVRICFRWKFDHLGVVLRFPSISVTPGHHASFHHGETIRRPTSMTTHRSNQLSLSVELATTILFTWRQIKEDNEKIKHLTSWLQCHLDHKQVSHSPEERRRNWTIQYNTTPLS